MAGNKAIYDTAMKRAHQYAWANQWDRAIKEYNRALAEIPDDPTARRNMAQCLFRLKQWPQSQVAYQALLNDDPADLFAMNRLAEIYIALGQHDNAIATYNRLADLYVQGSQFHEAIRALRDLSRAMPKNMEVHNRLLQLAQEVSDKQAQLAEHLAISRLALDERNFGEAQNHVDAATALDPENTEVKKWAYTVRRRIAEATGGTNIMAGDASKTSQGLSSMLGTGLIGQKEQETPEAVLLLDRAVEAQDRGDYRAALEYYDGAVRAGARRPSAFYNAGLLHQQMEQPSLAIPYLERATRDPEFATSANYVLGQCHTSLGEYGKAVTAYERALSTIDVKQLTRNEADELIELYTATAEANMADHNPGRASSLYNQLVGHFKQHKWSHTQLADLERKAAEVYNTSIESKLAGISRGSKALNPIIAGGVGPTPSNPMGMGSVSWGRDPGNDSTRSMGGGTSSMGTNTMGTGSMGTNVIGRSSAGTSSMGTAAMGTSSMGTGTMPEAEAFDSDMLGSDMISQLPTLDNTPMEATRLMSDGLTGSTSMNSGKGTTIIENAERPAPSAEMATTLIRQPGSSLRTITEYLRASEIGAANPSGGLDEKGAPWKIDANTPTTTKEASGPFKMAQHTQTSLSTVALMGVEHQTMAVQLLIAEGERNLAEGMWDAAIDTCLSIMQADPLYLPVHMMLGDIYLSQSKTGEAITKYQTVMDTYMARQEPSNAAEVCSRLLELQPDNPSLQAKLGMLMMGAGRVDEAAKALLAIVDRHYRAGDIRRALEEGENLKVQLPDSSDIALAIGTYHMALGNRQDALAELGRALRLDPANDAALARLYLALASLNDNTQWDALYSLTERASKDKANTRLFMEELHTGLTQNAISSVYYGLALIADRAGLTDVAADSLDHGLMQLSLAPTSQLGDETALLEVLMSQFRGDLALNIKDGATAIQHYKRAIDRLKMVGGWTSDIEDPENTNTPTQSLKIVSPRPQYAFLRLPEPGTLLYGLAEACAIEDDWSDAVDALRQLKSVMPNDNTVHTRLADIYFRQGLLSQALGELNDLLISYQKANDHEKTLEALGHMARMSPNNTAVRRKLSDMYLKLGMTEYGLAELDTLAELQLKAGQLKEAMRTYQKSADLYYTLGQHDEAIKIYERIVRLAPRDIDTRQQLINMYIQSGKTSEAIASERSLSEIFIQDGQVEGAIAALHQLLALAPEDVLAHQSLAQQLMSLGEYGQAARLFGRLVRLDPDNPRHAIMQTEMQRMTQDKDAPLQENTPEEAKKESKPSGAPVTKSSQKSVSSGRRTPSPARNKR